MSLRKIYKALLTSIRFYIRHLFPLLKRLVQLIRRKEKRVSLKVQVTQGELVMAGRFVVELTITSRNVFMIHVNGLRIPVVGDNPIKVQLALKKGVRSMTIYGRGFGHRKTIPVPINNDKLVAGNVRMKRKLVAEMPAGLSPVVKLKNRQLSIRPLIFPIKKLTFPTIKRTPFILSQTLTGDLVERLARNSKTNEQ